MYSVLHQQADGKGIKLCSADLSILTLAYSETSSQWQVVFFFFYGAQGGWGEKRQKEGKGRQTMHVWIWFIH